MVATPTKIFSGKRYKIWQAFSSKSKANRMAKDLRDGGDLARVYTDNDSNTPQRNRYVVYHKE